MREPSTRNLIKGYLVTERGHCEWPDGLDCHVPGSNCDMHEIVSRGRTVNNDHARALSFYPQVTVLLCRHHHGHAAGMEAELLDLNIDRYGVKAVAEVYCGILNALHVDTLGIRLPERLHLAIYGERDRSTGLDTLAVRE